MNDMYVQGFFDYDGAIRFYGSRNQRRNRKNELPGYLDRAHVKSENGFWYTWNWSKELVYKLNLLKNKYNFSWNWLTTWTGETQLIEQTLHVSGTDTPWDMEPEFLKHKTNFEKRTYWIETKLSKVLEFHNANPEVPFFWVDDDAGLVWSEEISHTINVPHLVITPDSLTGMSLKDIDTLEKFLERMTV